jgi:hypothetical protein
MEVLNWTRVLQVGYDQLKGLGHPVQLSAKVCANSKGVAPPTTRTNLWGNSNHDSRRSEL